MLPSPLTPDRARLSGRGPSWDAQVISDPVWTTRVTLGSKPEEDEHVLLRYQFAVHLGAPMPIDIWQNGKRRGHLTRFGDLAWTPAGDSCRATWSEPREMGFVTFSKELVSRVAEESGAGKAPDDTPGLRDALTRELVLALIQHDQGDRIYRDALGHSLLVHVLRSLGQVKPVEADGPGRLSNRQLQRAIEYADSRLGGELNLESWAQEVGLSPYHFARCFKRSTGLAPHQFVLRRRIERAKSMLAGSDAQLSAVAYELGFANQSHFQRVFRKETRMTPKEWRSSAAVQHRFQPEASLYKAAPSATLIP